MSNLSTFLKTLDFDPKRKKILSDTIFQKLYFCPFYDPKKSWNISLLSNLSTFLKTIDFDPKRKKVLSDTIFEKLYFCPFYDPQKSWNISLPDYLEWY